MDVIQAGRRETRAYVDAVIVNLPGSTGVRLRRSIWARRVQGAGRDLKLGVGITIRGAENISIGDDFVAMPGCVLSAEDAGNLVIGSGVNFNSNVCVDASQGGVIRIGSGSGLAHNCVVRSSPHIYDDPKKLFKVQGHRPGSIFVGEDCLIAANVVLLPGAVLGRGCVVGSGSVVGGQYPDFSILAGNPARVIARRGVSDAP